MVLFSHGNSTVMVFFSIRDGRQWREKNINREQEITEKLFTISFLIQLSQNSESLRGDHRGEQRLFIKSLGSPLYRPSGALGQHWPLSSSLCDSHSCFVTTVKGFGNAVVVVLTCFLWQIFSKPPYTF